MKFAFSSRESGEILTALLQAGVSVIVSLLGAFFKEKLGSDLLN